MRDKVQDNLPPHNIEAERAILGSILLDSKSINGCIDRINSSHFYNHSHKIIFDCLVSLKNTDIIPDVTTACTALKESTNLENIGAPAYLAALIDNTPSAANFSYYIDILIELSERREAIESLKR